MLLTSAVQVHAGPLSVELTPGVDCPLGQGIGVTGVHSNASFQSIPSGNCGSSDHRGRSTISY